MKNFGVCMLLLLSALVAVATSDDLHCPGADKSVICTLELRADCLHQPKNYKCPSGSTCCLKECEGVCRKPDGSYVKAKHTE